MQIDELTLDFLADYMGGKMEWRKRSESSVYRGQIKSIGIRDNTLYIRLTWCAQGVYNEVTDHIEGWVSNPTHDYPLLLANDQSKPMVTVTQNLNDLRFISNEHLVVITPPAQAQGV
ncbi:MAG TPA: hypothetical protein VFT87_03345 [Candidatus Saccharimonadales bacterium]|nr:hypothetical protein [Candidatus Saccharimonadales bacterium]